MIERAFEFLFKYKSFVFAKGSVALGASWGSLAVAFVLVAVAVPLLRGYPSVGGKSSPRDRVVLALLRVGVLALILLCVLRPSLVVATAVPQQNFVGLLLDDSRSMRIADVDETPRSDFATRQLEPTPDSLRTRLEERFKLRLFRFSDSAGRLDQVEDLRYAGSRTDLGNALDRTRQELASLPLSGLVVITDGADNASDGLEETLSSLRDSGVPVFTIGVGAEEFDRDIEISRIETPGEVLEGSAVGADVVIRQRGFDGETVELFVEDGGRILSSQTVRLPRSGESTVVRATFLAQEPGARLVTFRIAVQDSEMVRENNEQEALVRVRGEVERILYFEGEPRHEVAFIRRALQDDQNLAVVKLVNTAENKFWREIVDPEERYGGEEELYSGFPRTREELYAYAGLILGSVGADQFTPDQQRMIADFVSQRGGGLLTLGGRNSFARGGWAGTPVEEVLPVVLATRVPEPDEYLEVKITPTLFGRSHPVVQLEESAEASQARWQELPPLVTVNPMTQTRPGAVTLLEGRSDGASAAQVILAYQRYGAGRSIAFNVVDSWQWQMHYDIPLEDMTHETLWQQLLRWLVSDVDGQCRRSCRGTRLRRESSWRSLPTCSTILFWR